VIARSPEDVERLCAHLHEHGGTVVFTNGCFDILHAGHVTYLEAARALGDTLVVGLNDDDSVCRLKGPGRPVNGVEDRATVLAGLRAVDHVVVFSEDTPLNVITKVLPTVLVKGGDYTRDTVVGADVVEAHGGRVHIIPLLSGRSTTSIIDRAKNA
jgi:D-beta-D-heptose 7-phosphate kinase/D-beta-D-heptose 1-phosphate adenosyltransferase